MQRSFCQITPSDSQDAEGASFVKWGVFYRGQWLKASISSSTSARELNHQSATTILFFSCHVYMLKHPVITSQGSCSSACWSKLRATSLISQEPVNGATLTLYVTARHRNFKHYVTNTFATIALKPANTNQLQYLKTFSSNTSVPDSHSKEGCPHPSF